MNSGTMNTDKHIEQLLSRFLDGISTLEEEAQLATYFRTQQVPDEWQVYQDMFALFDRGEVEVQREGDKYEEGREKTPKRFIWRWAAAAAAIILLALTLPRLFKDPARQEEVCSAVSPPSPPPPFLHAKADSTRTQRTDSTATGKGIPEHVIREIEHIKYKTPRHLIAQTTPEPQPVASDEDLPTTGVTRQEPPAVEDDINREQLRNLAETYSRMSLEEYLAAMAKQEEEEVKAIRQRGKELERSMMMANSPESY